MTNPAPPKKKRRRKWRWILAAILLLISIAVATPFLFTTTLVRWALNRTAYARFSPEISAASLSPSGTLTVHGLVLHEPGGENQPPLLEAPQVTVHFSWLQIIGGHMQDITAREMTVHLRPVSAGNETLTPSLAQLALISPATPETTHPTNQWQAATTTPASDRPFWFDRLTCTGTINLEPFPQLNLAAAAQPFNLTITMRGDPFHPTRDFSLLIGLTDNDSAPLRANATLAPHPTGQQLAIQRFEAHDIPAGMDQPLAQSLLHNAPAFLQQTLNGYLQELAITGTLTFLPAATTFDGQLVINDLSLSSMPAAPDKLELKGLHLVANAAGPLSADFLKTGSITAATLVIDSLEAGNNSLRNLTTPITLSAGVLAAPDLKTTFLDGDFSGIIQYAASTNSLLKADLTVSHLDQKQLAANLAPGTLDADGAISGTIKLSTAKTGHLTGTIDLTADGPGHLRISDPQIGQQLAAKLAATDPSGTLPPNFSDIVIGQLKDYPYKTGQLHIGDFAGVVLLSVDYQRQPVAAGEPGFAVKTTIAGQQVLANYTVQLPGISVVLRQSIEQLLAMAAGFREQITRPAAPQ